MGEGDTDWQVICRIREGEVDAYAALLEKYRDRVAALVSRYVPANMVAEVAQEVFVSAFFSINSYTPRQPFEHWLLRVAVRRSYDYWRKQYRSREKSFSALSKEELRWVEAAMTAPNEESTEGSYDQAHAANVLEAALLTLSPEDRMVITLVHLEGLSVREAADQLGWSTVNVKVRAHRARKKLAALLEEI